MRTEYSACCPVEGVPEPIGRPALALFLWERGVQFRPAGKAIGKSHEYVRLICLPFGDPRRLIPDAETAEKIREWTGGAVAPDSFDPPSEPGR